MRRFLVSLLVLACVCSVSQADFTVYAVYGGNVNATAGSTGNTFDVYLTNDGSTVDLSGYNITLSVSAGITFTGVTNPSSDYVFSNPSVGFGISSNVSTMQIDWNDIVDTSLQPSGYVPIPSSATRYLGRVSFNVDAGAASGSYSVLILTASAATQFSDGTTPVPNPINFSTTSGTITVTGGGGAAVPELSTMALTGLGIGVAGLISRRKTNRSHRASSRRVN